MSHYSKLIRTTISIFVLFFVILSSVNSQISEQNWKQVLDRQEIASDLFTELPSSYALFDIELNAFNRAMENVEQEIDIPDPNGNFITYIIKPSQVIAKIVEDEYTIKTFRGYQKSEPTTLIACDISTNGFNAAIYNSGGTYFVTPNSINNPTKHLVYYKRDQHTNPIKCLMDKLGIETEVPSPDPDRSFAPNKKRIYRLAVAASGEYSQQFGGNPYSATNVLNAIASGVNMINPIYLRDLGVEFNLVSNSSLVWSNASTDPFNPNGSPWQDSHSAITSALGSGGFDVGHLVMWANTGGAAISGICSNGFKGQGFSGTTGSVVTLWVDYVAHEIGHQFGMPHNFSNSCSGNVVTNFKYEVGEGSSIMCYAGVCSTGPQNASDPFFHIRSISAANSTMNNSHNCISNTTTAGNSSIPNSNALSDITIPKETPFILVGSASDPNDPVANLTYQWEQDDGNGPSTSGAPNCSATNSPNFRFFDPVSVNYRHFPVYSQVINGNNNNIAWEKLPCAARVMDFSLTIRDNNTSWGRTDFDLMRVTVANTGPFNVTSPNGGETLSGNATITWSVNGTNAHCSNVDILLSLDGGTSYTVIADAIPNDGNENITLPSVTNTTARIIVRCDVSGGFRSTSTFYDVSDANFTIDPSTSSCPSNLTLTGMNGGGDYEADGDIISNQTIPNITVVDYDSKTQVILNSGFNTINGSTFCAFIDGCGGSQ